MEFEEVIFSRKSIRSFSDQEISDEILMDIVRSARVAPSFQNGQCWRFIIVKNKKNIKKLALKSGFIGKINFFIKDAPLIIIACADPKESGRVNGQDYYLVDTAIAFQQMMLTAWDRGIGTCWLAAFNEKKVKKILDIPKDIRVVAISPFGYPKKKKNIYGKAVKLFANSKNRKDIEEILKWETW